MVVADLTRGGIEGGKQAAGAVGGMRPVGARGILLDGGISRRQGGVLLVGTLVQVEQDFLRIACRHAGLDGGNGSSFGGIMRVRTVNVSACSPPANP